MAKDNRGHHPVLKVNGAEKFDHCKECGDEKRRGRDWQRACPKAQIQAAPA